MWSITIDNLPPVQLNVQGYVGPELAQAINDSPDLNGTLSATWDDNTPTLQLSNLTSNNVRVRMTKTGWGVAVPLISQNPTAHQSVTEESVYELIFCLSAAQIISCEGATSSVTIINKFNDGEGGNIYNSDIEVFVNGVSRGISSYTVDLLSDIDLPEGVLCDYDEVVGTKTTITNTSNEPIRLELRAIEAPEYRGGVLTIDPNTGVYNPSTVIEFPEGNVTSLVAEGDNPWDILKVCLAPAGEDEGEGGGGEGGGGEGGGEGGDGEGGGDIHGPTNYAYNSDVFLNIPSVPSPTFYFKVHKLTETGGTPSVTEHILTFPVERIVWLILFIEFLQVILDATGISFVGELTYDSGSAIFSHNCDFGQFKVLHSYDSLNSTYRVNVEGLVTGEGGEDVETTLTFLEPTQAELDDYSNQHGVTALNGAWIMFRSYPTWHSCSRVIPA